MEPPAEQRDASTVQGRGSLVQTWPGALALGFLLAGAILAFQASLADRTPTRPRTPRLSRTLASPDVDALPVINHHGLELQLLLLRPEAFGVDSWKVGDSAVYRYRGSPTRAASAGLPADDGTDQRSPDRDVRIAVIGQCEETDVLVQQGLGTPGNYWLRISGLTMFRYRPNHRFVLAHPRDMRPTRRSRIYELDDGYFPNASRFLDMSGCNPAELERIGTEVLETPAGSIECERFTAHIGSAALEIWASPLAPPLGIVRLRSEMEELSLVSVFEESEPIEIAPVIAPLIRGESTFALGCLSCHFDSNDCHSTSTPAR